MCIEGIRKTVWMKLGGFYCPFVHLLVAANACKFSDFPRLADDSDP